MTEATSSRVGQLSYDNPPRRSRAEILASARPLPPVEEMVFEDLTEEEQRVFWETITSA